MFTVIIPLYNKENMVSAAINSVLTQSYNDFELLVIDDGSTDGSYDAANSIVDSRLTIIRQKNGGVSAARNTGINKATGQYICFLDADDLWLPNHLEALKKLIALYPDAGLYATRYRLIEFDGTEKVTPMDSETMLVDDLFALELGDGLNRLHTNSVCIPRHIFEKVGMFVVGEKTGEDGSLWLRVAAYYSVALSQKITTVYQREYSDAFVGVALNPDWSFMRIAQEVLLPNLGIPCEKKLNIQRYINRYRQSLCRHSLLTGDRYAAKLYYKQVRWDWSGFRNKLITDICFGIPPFLLRRIYHRKYHGSFSNKS